MWLAVPSPRVLRGRVGGFMAARADSMRATAAFPCGIVLARKTTVLVLVREMLGVRYSRACHRRRSCFFYSLFTSQPLKKPLRQTVVMALLRCHWQASRMRFDDAVPRLARPRRNTLAVESTGDAVEPQAFVPERPHALYGHRFALVVAQRACGPRSGPRAPVSLPWRQPVSARSLTCRTGANTPIIYRNAMRLRSDAIRSGSMTLIRVKPCSLK
jgi:hypothetical protein